MPPVGVMAVLALGVISYVYVGKPIVHVTKKVSHKVCHVVTIGNKCK